MYSDMCNISFPVETIVSTVERVVHEKDPEEELFLCELCDSSSSFKDRTKNPVSVVFKCFMLSFCC